MDTITTNNYKDIVLNETHLIDVRAPIEFEKGAFINSVNIPIMDNEQRHIIGTTYVKQGHDEAVELGYNLVSGKNKEQKLKKWCEHITKYPDTILYCFRGGQRSQISQEWIQNELNKEILRIEGGFKAFRNYLLDSIDPKNQTFKPIRLGGRTGSGKTILLNEIDYSIDLEGIAHHRGSAFGNYINPQPSPIEFENLLAYRLIQKGDKPYLIFEDEGRHVGRCFIPKEFSTHYMSSPLVVLDVSLLDRANNILQEYVIESQSRYIETFGEEGLEKWFNYICTSFSKTKKKLGAVRYNTFIEEITRAFNAQLSSSNNNKFDEHLQWINDFLVDYYDPMYEYQLERGKDNIIFTGDFNEVKEYLDKNYKQD